MYTTLSEDESTKSFGNLIKLKKFESSEASMVSSVPIFCVILVTSACLGLCVACLYLRMRRRGGSQEERKDVEEGQEVPCVEKKKRKRKIPIPPSPSFCLAAPCNTPKEIKQ